MKNKLFAPFLTLLSVALSLAVMLLFTERKLKDIVVILLVVLIVFYIIGLAIQNRVNKFIEENEEKLRLEAEAEGAVIEKEAPDAAEEEPQETEEEYKLPPLTGAMSKRPGEADADEFTQNAFRDSINE